MMYVQGLWWPDDVGAKWQHSLRHVRSLDWALAHAQRRRTAVQAGGNVGLWPRKMAAVFDRVITFEPDETSRACLLKNVASLPNVEVRSEALGRNADRCAIEHRSLGSHRVIHGDAVAITTVDALALDDLDLLQLDIEGYEWHALNGATATLARCRPLVQVELRDFGEHYGYGDDAVRTFLASFGYRKVSAQAGHDVVFEVAS